MLHVEIDRILGTDPQFGAAGFERLGALFRCGRQAEAPAVHAELRDLLREEQGLDPSRAVTELQAGILAGDRELER
ncbi:BTAD domain-containing putative transcriptional regulator [Kitasatospora sp. NPDC049285]|uniref:BTAD domain-containing putative transcriptional regulator n=1 Tax=Kitasatospora sp. NPDC049285 TaxID=3157096 RepID=UPI0034221BAF